MEKVFVISIGKQGVAPKNQFATTVEELVDVLSGLQAEQTCMVTVIERAYKDE